MKLSSDRSGAAAARAYENPQKISGGIADPFDEVESEPSWPSPGKPSLANLRPIRQKEGRPEAAFVDL
jgi:hypothetical protein